MFRSVFQHVNVECHLISFHIAVEALKAKIVINWDPTETEPSGRQIAYKQNQIFEKHEKKLHLWLFCIHHIKKEKMIYPLYRINIFNQESKIYFLHFIRNFA